MVEISFLRFKYFYLNSNNNKIIPIIIFRIKVLNFRFKLNFQIK